MLAISMRRIHANESTLKFMCHWLPNKSIFEKRNFANPIEITHLDYE